MADAKTQIVPIEPTREMLSRMEGMTDFVLPEGLENTKQARMAEMRFAWGEALSAAPQPAASDVPHDVVRALEIASLLREADAHIVWEANGLGNDFADRVEAALATPAPSTSTAPEPDLDAWADAFANWRQGQRSTPRCEAPGAADIRICRDLIKGMLACRPAPSTSTEEALVEQAARASYEYEGDRKGIDYAGWDLEPENVKRQWRESVSVPLAVALADNARLRAALRNNFCPRPCNHRPDQFGVGGCVDAGECGCMNVTALSTPR